MIRDAVNALSRPWALDRKAFDALVAAIKGNIAGDATNILGGTRDKRDNTPTLAVEGGVATIPIRGVLTKRSDFWSRLFGDSTVESIREDLAAALADSSVEAIVFDVDSPGGSVDGIAELADEIFAARAVKPSAAFTDGLMASAAYHLASAAGSVVASRSAEVGSIGVYATVWDESVALHNEGLKVEIIKAGKFKAAGHPATPLTADARSVIQESVDDFMAIFTSAVQRGRAMSDEQVDHVATGRTWIAAKAQELGLVDRVQTRREFVAAFAAENVGGKKRDGGRKMAALTQAELEKAAADKGAADAAAKKAADDAAAAVAAKTAADTEAAKKKAADDAAAAALASDPVAAERDRARAILEASFPGQEKLAAELIAKGTPKAESIAELRGHELARIKREGGGTPGPSADDAMPINGAAGPDKWKREFAASAALQTEFRSVDAYVAFMAEESRAQ